MEYFRQRFKDNLNQNWPVNIGEFSWPSADVFKAMAEGDYEASFSEWVQGQKQDAKDRAREFLEETRGLERFRTLTQKYKSGYVIPFVGAGMSIPSGFRPWGAFLTSLLADAPQLRAQVDSLLSQGHYEQVAQLIHDTLGAGIFAEEIHNQLGSHRRSVAGPVALLPHLFQEAVITTNFDYVLKYAYADAQLPFSNDFCGRRLREARQRIGNEPHCLLRLHGEADVEEGRVLTQREYEEAYNGGITLTNILGGLLGARSLLFMGSSLQSDRTYAALCALKVSANDAPIRHYAFLPCPSEDGRNSRRIFLDNAGIHPIYYPADNHDQCIEDLLVSLMEGGLDD